MAPDLIANHDLDLKIASVKKVWDVYDHDNASPNVSASEGGQGGGNQQQPVFSNQQQQAQNEYITSQAAATEFVTATQGGGEFVNTASPRGGGGPGEYGGPFSGGQFNSSQQQAVSSQVGLIKSILR